MKKFTTSTDQAFKAACQRYAAAFPDDCTSDWIHPEFLWTVECVTVMDRAIARGTPVTSDEVDKEFGPFAWDW
jgi:hypothetical protein